MAKAVSLKISGLDTIDAALRDLPREVRTTVLTDALQAGAEVLRQGVAEKIHDRTQRTREDLRVEVQVKETEAAGVAAVGGSTGKTGRNFVLRFLERGTRPHAEPKKKPAKGEKRRLMAFGGRVVSRVKHPGTKAQAPMRITVGTHGAKVIQVFAAKTWDGISAFCQKRARA